MTENTKIHIIVGDDIADVEARVNSASAKLKAFATQHSTQIFQSKVQYTFVLFYKG